MEAIRMQEAIKQNNIKKYDLSIGHDFDLANKILETGEYTEHLDASYIYNERISNSFVGTYSVQVTRYADYEEFLSRLEAEVRNNPNVTNYPYISFDEWKSGYILDKHGRKQKLGKTLKKHGFSQKLLDFYSTQIKDNKQVYLTISDRVQHIAGMSFFSNGLWSSMGGSSCQDPRNSAESRALAGSLYDDKLLVAFLHERLEDLEEMEDQAWEAYKKDPLMEDYRGKVIARSVCRIIHVQGKQFLISTRKYGNNATKNYLEKAIRQLNPFGIFTIDQMEGEGSYYHKEHTNGTYDEWDSIYIDEEVDEYVDVTVTCPYCGGDGNVEWETPSGAYVKIDCFVCGGHGEIDTEVNIYQRVQEEIEAYVPILPYAEEYDHAGDYIRIKINPKVLGLE